MNQHALTVTSIAWEYLPPHRASEMLARIFTQLLSAQRDGITVGTVAKDASSLLHEKEEKYNKDFPHF